MFPSIVAIATLALASTATALGGFSQTTDTGGQCCYEGLRHCQQDQGDWGCVKITDGGPNCVKQTHRCDSACGGTGYAYLRTRSDDHTCICTYADASQENPNC